MRVRAADGSTGILVAPADDASGGEEGFAGRLSDGAPLRLCPRPPALLVWPDDGNPHKCGLFSGTYSEARSIGADLCK